MTCLSVTAVLRPYRSPEGQATVALAIYPTLEGVRDLLVFILLRPSAASLLICDSLDLQFASQTISLLHTSAVMSSGRQQTAITATTGPESGVQSCTTSGLVSGASQLCEHVDGRPSSTTAPCTLMWSFSFRPLCHPWQFWMLPIGAPSISVLLSSGLQCSSGHVRWL